MCGDHHSAPKSGKEGKGGEEVVNAPHPCRLVILGSVSRFYPLSGFAVNFSAPKSGKDVREGSRYSASFGLGILGSADRF